MTHQPSISPKSASANGCCGGAGAEDKRPAEPTEAKPTAASPPEARPGDAKPSGSCCGSGADAHTHPDAHQARP